MPPTCNQLTIYWQVAKQFEGFLFQCYNGTGTRSTFRASTIWEGIEAVVGYKMRVPDRRYLLSHEKEVVIPDDWSACTICDMLCPPAQDHCIVCLAEIKRGVVFIPNGSWNGTCVEEGCHFTAQLGYNICKKHNRMQRNAILFERDGNGQARSFG